MLLVSAVQQGETVIYIPSYFTFYSHVGYYKELNRVSCALQYIFIYFMYSKVYLSILTSPSPFFGNHMYVLYI